MTATTDIEKKSLEAHVELCAERYKSLEDQIDLFGRRLDGLDQKINTKIGRLEDMLEKLMEKLDNVESERNKQIITWAVSAAGILSAALATVVWYMLIQ